MRRVALAALAVAALAILLVWRRSQAAPDALPAAPVGSPPADRPHAAGPKPVPARREPTRDELYERAKELGIKGRSKMNKAELQRAVASHEGG